jgi:hypothetical protein
MNTNPDEVTLALWLEDELSGEELTAMEAWAGGHPDQLAARDQARRWRATMAAAMPGTVEPPYPDFFNNRVMHALRQPSTPVETTAKKSFFRGSWWMPATACVGMALTFWAGKNSQVASTPELDFANAPRAIPVEPTIYTPETGVKAVWFASTEASATVIVLNGVAAIPDSTDFPETAYLPPAPGDFATASIETEPTSESEP